mmetsp:Transcript_37556/g.58656  ORF Transcript_37556/g.58656 Transcript_37556/m.58656 type:complete len:88 (+) Transcript_37556:2-265(+)
MLHFNGGGTGPRGRGGTLWPTRDALLADWWRNGNCTTGSATVVDMDTGEVSRKIGQGDGWPSQWTLPCDELQWPHHISRCEPSLPAS